MFSQCVNKLLYCLVTVWQIWILICLFLMKYVYWLRKDKEVNSGVVLHKFWINGCYFRYNWCKLLYYCHLQGHPTLFACFSQCLWSALENFLSSSNASAQECSNGLSFLWEGEHSVYKGFCDEGRSHPFWQSKGWLSCKASCY